jgi:hypothetical protein
MSSFTQHEKNIESLKEMGFNVSHCYDDSGGVTLESWGYDELVDLVTDVVEELKKKQFTLQPNAR